MPELPEVETVRNVLKLWCVNKKIKKFYVYYPSVIENSDENTLNTLLCSKTIIDIKRRGKFLIFDLGDYVLLSHLRMEGKWHYGYFKGEENLAGFAFNPLNKDLDKDFKHVHFVIELENKQILMYHDVRKFGRIGLYSKETYESESPLSKLGKEPFDDTLNALDLFNSFKKEKMGLKQMLLSQKYIVGVGNIYADEICFKLGLLPTTPINTLSLKNCEDLIKVTIEVLNKAIELGGSTIKSYHAANNVDGKFQNELLAYGKEGQVCPRCGYTFYKTFLNGRGTTFCPACQKSNLANRIIGVSGAIGSGKSMVSSLIEKEGYILLDADKIVKEGQEIGNVLYKKMITLFKGINILNDDKSLNRGLIRNLILENKELKEKLENIIHPYVKSVIYENILAKINAKFVLDIPLLYESNLDKICDKVIYVNIDPLVQQERLLLRGAMPLKEAKALENSIYTNKEKIEKADFVISNNASLAKLEKEVKLVLEKIN